MGRMFWHPGAQADEGMMMLFGITVIAFFVLAGLFLLVSWIIKKVNKMETIELKFITDFTPYPGGRSRDVGDHSAEEFYEDILRDKFKQAIDEDKKLIVNLDGAAGYAGSFLDEAFGRLGHEFGLEECKKRLDFITEEEPYLKDDIFGSIEEWAVDGIHYNSPMAKGKKLKESNYFTSVKKKK